MTLGVTPPLTHSDASSRTLEAANRAAIRVFFCEMDSQPELTWPRLAAFVRQHTHDVRNDLNSLDLEASLLGEIVGDEKEAAASLARIRRQVRDLAGRMKSLSTKFCDPHPTTAEVAVHDLFLIWQDQVAKFDPAPQVNWHEDVGDTRVSVDVEALARAFHELLANAVSFGTGKPVKAEAIARDGHVTFELTEPKDGAVDPESWGNTPLLSTRRGGYGLGLWEIGRGIVASGGEIRRIYDPAAKTLITRVIFPSASK